jgi:hypothetical protein
MATSRNRNNIFRDLLGYVESENAARLMKRAQVANRLAKSLRGRARSHLYSIKTDSLLALQRSFPEKVKVRHDWRCAGEFVLVEVRAARFGLHAPEPLFAENRIKESLPLNHNRER